MYVGGRAFQTLPRWSPGLVGIALLAVARPWAALPMVDLRGAASHCARIRAAGGSCDVHLGLRGIDFYEPRVARFENLDRIIPPDATVLVVTTPRESSVASPPDFEEYARLPGWERDVVLLRRVSPLP
jgi:hypothetical protein